MKNFTQSASKYCEICDKTFNSVHGLKIHTETIHEGLKKYQCKICSKSFGHAFTLKRHKEAKKYNVCNKSGKALETEKALNTHYEINHVGLKNYKCYECGNGFGEAGSLKKHIDTVHENLKKYKCNECGKNFSQTGSLKIHIEVYSS